MPTMVQGVLERLLAELDGGADTAVLEHEGRSRPLPMALRRETALVRADRLLEAGVRRLRVLAEEPGVHVIPETEWRTVDPEARTLRDIDTPDDLGR
jgi:molybdopterin-guanine dinucleotide biosynthesis protein A